MAFSYGFYNSLKTYRVDVLGSTIPGPTMMHRCLLAVVLRRCFWTAMMPLCWK